MAPPRKSVRLARELAESPTGRLRKRFINPFVLRRLCALASEKISCGDRDGLWIARLCCRLAQKLKTAEARALSFGRLASALRLAGRLDHAERALAVALAAAPADLAGDLIRRRACNRLYQGRLKEAIEDARTALDQTSGQARAKVYEVLGIALFNGGDHSAGIRELKRCLETTDPDHETAYCNALQNYAKALGEGTDEGATEALALCTKLRAKLQDRHKMQRAKLWWTIGLLHLRLDDLQEAWRALDIARRSLLALRAVPEMAAIVADMARVAAEPQAVRHICLEAAAVINAPHPLIEPLADLSLAPSEMIPTASAALHEAASQLAAFPAL